MVGLRKGPQEYHSAPVKESATCDTFDERRDRTCNPGSAVVEALEVGDGVDDVARGKDIDLLGNGLAVITTVIQILGFHWRHC